MTPTCETLKLERLSSSSISSRSGWAAQWPRHEVREERISNLYEGPKLMWKNHATTIDMQKQHLLKPVAIFRWTASCRGSPQKLHLCHLARPASTVTTHNWVASKKNEWVKIKRRWENETVGTVLVHHALRTQEETYCKQTPHAEPETLPSCSYHKNKWNYTLSYLKIYKELYSLSLMEIMPCIFWSLHEKSSTRN